MIRVLSNLYNSFGIYTYSWFVTQANTVAFVVGMTVLAGGLSDFSVAGGQEEPLFGTAIEEQDDSVGYQSYYNNNPVQVLVGQSGDDYTVNQFDGSAWDFGGEDSGTVKGNFNNSNVFVDVDGSGKVLGSGFNVFSLSKANYNDSLVKKAIGNIFCLIEGAFGALIMVIAGLGAIIAASMGAYRSSVSMLVVAVGAFILRSLVSLFFGEFLVGQGAACASP